MKKIITFICISLFCTISLFAQDKKGGSREKITAIKVAYLTEQLNLTSSEAEKFWPIYNVYVKKQRALRNRLKVKLMVENKGGKIDTITEAEAEKLVDLKLDISKQIQQSEAVFYSKVQKVISFKKILKLQIAEIEFGRQLMKKYKGKRGNSNK